MKSGILAEDPSQIWKDVYRSKIKESLITNGYFILRWRRDIITLDIAEKMYSVHKTKPFYIRLVSMMTSGPAESFVLARENAIKHWRTMMGPTRVLESQYTHPYSLRSLYGTSNTRNATHGADSLESMKNEVSIFFPDFDVDAWYEDEEVYFRNGYSKFDEDLQIHVKEDIAFPDIIKNCN
ncbi:nucleoside diphosphate kinase 6 isoform X2 [Cimex lectularius]|uniref:Nucleoside diphosphate kinase-like domain-containing protein n=1 Tax=Cimex lectularius TaxID=79782 RepID=A0A8I6R6V1_CIMLE|nr:nucleoside diphosphate kinase 6 isoform X2 [Cimex lectularius]